MLSPFSIHCPFLAIFVLISDIMSGSVDAENSLKEVQESEEALMKLLKEVIEKIKSLLSDE